MDYKEKAKELQDQINAIYQESFSTFISAIREKKTLFFLPGFDLDSEAYSEDKEDEIKDNCPCINVFGYFSGEPENRYLLGAICEDTPNKLQHEPDTIWLITCNADDTSVIQKDTLDEMVRSDVRELLELLITGKPINE